MRDGVIRTPKIFEKILPSAIWGGYPDHCSKRLFLSFDDGPEQNNTVSLLKKLDDYNIKAAFFIRGDKLLNNLDLIHSIKNKGHLIGYHGYSHHPWWFLNKKQLEYEINPFIHFPEIADELRNIFGFPLFLRPPYGRFDPSVFHPMKRLSGKLMFWRLVVGDWKSSKSTEQIIKDLENNSRSGDLITLHDGGVHGKDLPDIIGNILNNKNNNISFADINELLEADNS